MRLTSRREFMTAAGAALLAGGCAGGRRDARLLAGSLPNIVYILADDLGYGDLSCLNPASKIPTPYMDRLAGEGVIFTDAHSGSAVCTPTRYGIMTGRYCWRSRLQAHVLEGHSEPLIAKDRATVASLLKNHGYRTACIGKWHLGLGWATVDGKTPRPGTLDYSKRIDNGPTTLGFDYFFGIPASLDMIPYVFVENDRVVEPPSDRIVQHEAPGFFRGGPIAPGFRHEEVLPTLTRKAVECIGDHAAKHKGQPLFLYFPLTAPHTPVLPTAEHRGKSKAGAYGDFVCQADATIGTVLEALERKGMADDTLVIVTSDNGFAPMAGLKELKDLGHEPSFHFRGHKADIYEGGHHIPFIARWPGRINPGSTCNHLTCLTDLMATAADIVGARLPDNAGEDSVSMLSALTGRAAAPGRQDIVHHSVHGNFSIRRGQWKLELCAGSGGWSDPKEPEAKKQGLPKAQLYDLDADISERTNVQQLHPDIVRELTNLLDRQVKAGRSTPGAPQKNDGEVNVWGPTV